jgi:D-glycero-beta-D-manno-heptose-7-phosphate kinase
MREYLLKVLDQFKGRKIVVVGDLIADEFLYGQIARISREAPVLVLEYRDLVRLPGGAANAANNLLDLDCETVVAGAVGQDDAGSNLVEILQGKGADVRHIRKVRSYSTPIKTRILAGAHHSARQQVVRIDRICRANKPIQIPWNPLLRSLRSAHGIIVSDYGYGAVGADLFARLRHAAHMKGIPIVVDSRFGMSHFHGVTSMTPNITELEAATGTSIGADAELLKKVSSRVMGKQELGSLLVTQGKYGMTLFEAHKAPLHIPIYGTDEVADVTGAGDTVIAVFTLALACGASHEHAARLANYAGGIVVMKHGTATATRVELRAAITEDMHS